MRDDAKIEILFIENSSRDDRGRRVLIREGIVENWIYPDGLLDPVVGLLGITETIKKQIEDFFAVGRSLDSTLLKKER